MFGKHPIQRRPAPAKPQSEARRKVAQTLAARGYRY